MNCLHVPFMLMPKEGTDLNKWSVIACDQYTSQPEYWQETERLVGEEPSTLRMILPEVYLGGEDESSRIEKIHQSMEQYQADGTLRELPAGFMLVKRSLEGGGDRLGLVVEVDLETYEYRKGSKSLIRPTEMTVEERIPPRLRVRRTATVELPHIMLLIDDPEHRIIEPLFDRTGEFQKIYDTDLMQHGGHITGWLIPEGSETQRLMEQVQGLADPEYFRKRYDLKEDYPLLQLAVGDGNHSMATARAAWDEIKKDLSEEQREDHPARFCLCELVNIHDESLLVEPIHRVVFGVDPGQFYEAARVFYENRGCEVVIEDGTGKAEAEVEEHCFVICSEDGDKRLKVKRPAWGIAVATLQAFLDAFLAEHPESRIDYIHGEEVVRRLGSGEGNLGFLLPDIEKGDLFRGVILDGVLPRKTFSMGEAQEKRYYMECKSLKA